MAEEPTPLQIDAAAETATFVRMECVRTAIAINSASASLTGGADADRILTDAAKILAFVLGGKGTPQ